MINKKIEDIAENDILALVSSNAAESQTLDFKRELPGRDNSAKLEFCTDICAFADTQGGDIVYGVSAGEYIFCRGQFSMMNVH